LLRVLLITTPGCRASTVLLLRYRFQGYQVIGASSVEEGLKLATQHIDDLALVILDIAMPDQIGTELLREFEKSDTLRKVRRIVVTGVQLPEGTIKERIDGFFLKPAILNPAFFPTLETCLTS
jgi:response regulator RpfG family c-di-GMP phosphodiesterase